MKTRPVPFAVTAMIAVAATNLVACGAPSGTDLTLTAPSASSEDLQLPRAAEVFRGQLVAVQATGDQATIDTAGEGQSPVVVTRFVLGELGSMPTDSTGYYFDPEFEPSPTTVRTVASAFGLADSLRRVDPVETGNRWMAGDAAGAQFGVVGSTPVEWSFDDVSLPSAGANCDPSTETVPPNDPASDCNPVGPTAIELAARRLVKQIGIDADSMIWRVDKASDEMYHVTARPGWISDELAYAGLALEYEFTYDRLGQLISARGPMADPDRLGPYPLLDADGALSRLKANLGELVMYPSESGSVDGPGGFARPRPASTTATESPNTSTTAPTLMTTTSTTPQSGIETETLTIISVEPALSVLRAPDGGAWVLPAYRFTADDGSIYRVVAVADEYLIEVAADTAQGRPTSTAVNVGASTPPSTTLPPGTIIPVPEVLRAAVGLSLSAFEAVAHSAGFDVRVVSIDGVEQGRDGDFRTDRVNVAVLTAGGNQADPIVVTIREIG